MIVCSVAVQADDLLTGTVIGTRDAVDYVTNARTTSVNTCANAFDGDMDTFFASYDRSYTWAGLDLGQPYVITRVGWSPRNDVVGPDRVVLGVFEGANSPDFMDALPLYIIDERGAIGQMSYADVVCSRGFRYVRYVGPSNARCNIAELEFYGHPDVGDDSRLYQLTNLPTVSIHTLNGEIPYDKVHQIVSQLTIISDDGKHILSEPGTTRERGNYSRNFDKKPYRIKFDEKQHLLDAPAKAKKWTLINNYGDKTLMRNLLLCDQISVNKNRVAITEMTPRDDSGDALTGGYLIEVDAYANQEKSWFSSYKGTPVTIKSPEEDSITVNQRQYIQNQFNTMEFDIFHYLDRNTFLRHFLVGEMSGNTDTYWSVYMYKQRGDEMIYTGPVWDFDLAFDNDQRLYPVCNKSDFIYRSGGSVIGKMRELVDNFVLRNEESTSQMLNIWDKARQSGLTEENLVAWVDNMEQKLAVSQRLNFLRWPILNQRVHQNPKALGSFEAEVEVVRRFVKERLRWMDRRIGYTYVPSAINGIAVDLTKPYEVYAVSGQACGHSLTGLRPGIYIIRQGQASRKIVVH